MDPKNLVVGLGLGALGAAAIAYYGFAHVSDQEQPTKADEQGEQEKSKRPDPDQASTGEGLLDGVNRVIGKTFFKVGTSRATSEGTDNNNNSNNNNDDGSNNNNKVDTAAVKDEVTGALGNWGNFWKEQYKVQRVHQGGPEN